MARKKRNRKMPLFWITIAVIALSLAIAALFVYRTTHMKHWFATKDTVKDAVKAAVKTKLKPQLAASSEEQRQLHFDFYNTLPNQHLTLASIEKVAAANADLTPAKSPTPPAKKPKRIVISNTIFLTPAELEEKIAARVRQARQPK